MDNGVSFFKRRRWAHLDYFMTKYLHNELFSSVIGKIICKRTNKNLKKREDKSRAMEEERLE